MMQMHTVFECAHWQSYRSELTSTIGTFTAANIVGVMIASKENWENLVNYVERILSRRGLVDSVMAYYT